MSVGPSIHVAHARERKQIVDGLFVAVERFGPAALTEGEVVEAAGPSGRAFHEHFRDLDDCFDFACEAAVDILLGPMVAAWSVPRRRPERLGAALGALLGALAAQPRLAALCLLHSPVRQADRRTYGRVVDSLAELLLDIRPPFVDAGEPRPGGEQLLARSAVGLIAARLGDGEADLEELRPRLVALLLPALELDATD